MISRLSPENSNIACITTYVTAFLQQMCEVCHKEQKYFWITYNINSKEFLALWTLSIISHSIKNVMFWKPDMILSSDENMWRHLLRWIWIQSPWKLPTILFIWCFLYSGCLHQIDKNACYHSKLDLNFKQLLPAHRPQFVTHVLCLTKTGRQVITYG